LPKNGALLPRLARGISGQQLPEEGHTDEKESEGDTEERTNESIKGQDGDNDV
jgi:hypothetical protein